MRLLFQIISWLSLLGTILPAILFLAGKLDLDQVKQMLFWSTVVWFVFTPLWMGRPTRTEAG